MREAHEPDSLVLVTRCEVLNWASMCSTLKSRVKRNSCKTIWKRVRVCVCVVSITKAQNTLRSLHEWLQQTKVLSSVVALMVLAIKILILFAIFFVEISTFINNFWNWKLGEKRKQ